MTSLLHFRTFWQQFPVTLTLRSHCYGSTSLHIRLLNACVFLCASLNAPEICAKQRTLFTLLLQFIVRSFKGLKSSVQPSSSDTSCSIRDRGIIDTLSSGANSQESPCSSPKDLFKHAVVDSKDNSTLSTAALMD